MKHTPTPWVVGGFHKEIDTDGPNWVGIGNGRAAIARALDTALADGEMNAAFICRAVNAHEELLEAAKLFVDRHRQVPSVPANDKCVCGDCARFKAAIAKAEKRR